MVARKFQKRAVRAGLAAVFIAISGCAWKFTPAAWHHQPAFGKEAEAITPSPTTATHRAANLRVISWNVWGIPFATPARRERLEAIARLAASRSPDLVCFQEVFLETDRKTLCDLLGQAGLTHYRYFSSLPCGSGLLTLSRYPITAAAFHRFSKGGDPLAFKLGDWWAGKGAGAVAISVPGFGGICLVNTHLHARYKTDKYAALRCSQLNELMAFTAALCGQCHPTILAGDLNYRVTEKAWSDALRENHLLPLTRPWSPIDYILATANPEFRFSRVADDKLEGSIPASGVPLSDHKGLFSEFTIVPATSAARTR